MFMSGDLQKLDGVQVGVVLGELVAADGILM